MGAFDTRKHITGRQDLDIVTFQWLLLHGWVFGSLCLLPLPPPRLSSLPWRDHEALMALNFVLVLFSALCIVRLAEHCTYLCPALYFSELGRPLAVPSNPAAGRAPSTTPSRTSLRREVEAMYKVMKRESWGKTRTLIAVVHPDAVNHLEQKCAVPWWKLWNRTCLAQHPALSVISVSC